MMQKAFAERSLFQNEGISAEKADNYLNALVRFQAVWMPGPEIGVLDRINNIAGVVCIQSKQGYYGIKLIDMILFIPQEVQNE